MHTIREILAEVNRSKPCSRAWLYTYLRRLRIAPLGQRQRPQLYPADTAARILESLGMGAAPTLLTVKAAKRKGGAR